MTDLTPYTTVLGVAGLVLLIIQTFKPSIADKYLTFIPYAAVVLGEIIAFVSAFGLGMLDTNSHITQILFIGLLGGMGAIATYEMTLNKLPQSNTPPKI